MEHTIVSPWLIYFIGIVGNLQGVLILSSVLSGMAIAALFFFYYAEDIKPLNFRKWVTKLISVFIASIIFLTILPNKETCTQMVIAKLATYEKVAQATSLGKDFKDSIKKDILDIIKETKK